MDDSNQLFNRTITVNPTYDPDTVPTVITVKQKLPAAPKVKNGFKMHPHIIKT